MDFLDPKKKKAHKRQLYLGYLLVAIAIMFGGVILLFVAFGYRIDRRGNVTQNAAVYVGSTPSDALVKYTNTKTGQTKEAVTDKRLDVPPGDYMFEYLKEGYRPWQHSSSIQGGYIYRLSYPLLFPDKLDVTDAELFASKPKISSESPDRKKILVIGNNNEFSIYNADDPSQAPEKVTVPTDVITINSKTKISDLEWSTNNRHILFKFADSTSMKYVLVDTQSPENSYTINQRFNLNPKQVSLFDKRPDEFYVWQKNNNLVLANAGSNQSEPVVNNIRGYKSHGTNRLVYVKPNKKNKKHVDVYIMAGNESFKIRQLPTDRKYLLDIAEYDGKWYTVVASAGGHEAYIYKDAFEFLRDDNPARVLFSRTLQMDNPQKISFSDNAQFIAVQHGSKFAVYDAYQDQKFYYKFNSTFNSKNKLASWMDGFRMRAVVKNKVIVFDFDGTNYQTLSKITPGFLPLFNRDYSVMTSVAPSVNVKNKNALTTTSLRVQ